MSRSSRRLELISLWEYFFGIVVVIVGLHRTTEAFSIIVRQNSYSHSYSHYQRSFFFTAHSLPNTELPSSSSSTTTTKTTTTTTTTTPVTRKPKYYWNNLENVRRELREYWEGLNVTTTTTNENKDQKFLFHPHLPPIPSEALLNHFERHDLRQVICKYGGREELAELLGGCDIIPGKWNMAVTESLLVQALLKNPKHGLDADIPPLSPQQKKELQESNASSTTMSSSLSTAERNQGRWSYKNPNRRPHSYWTVPVLIQTLYGYLDRVRETNHRPAVWMPRPSEIKRAGEVGLYQAIARFGGGDKTAQIAGLVPYYEWRYFEGQMDLLKELTRYLDEFHGGNHSIFPTATEIKNNGYSFLYNNIQRYGGQKFLVARFGMDTVEPRRKPDFLEMNFGPFSIDFAISLLDYIRNNHMQQQAPLKPPIIRMPTEYELFTKGRNDLIDGIQKYGGYENVARRLGLDYLDPSTSVRSSSGRQRLC